MGMSDKTVRSYLDILTGTFMVRPLQPWHENLGKRQVKAPKVFLRDSGLLHSLLDIGDRSSLLANPRAGASFEGFVIEQVLRVAQPAQAFFWGTYAGAELDLCFVHGGKRHGIEVKFSEAPAPTRSMRTAIQDLALDHLWVVHAGEDRFPMEEKITAWPVGDLADLPTALSTPQRRRGSRGRRG
jgi:predicted AAA+ superfamily ATPase